MDPAARVQFVHACATLDFAVLDRLSREHRVDDDILRYAITSVIGVAPVELIARFMLNTALRVESIANFVRPAVNANRVDVVELCLAQTRGHAAMRGVAFSSAFLAAVDRRSAALVSAFFRDDSFSPSIDVRHMMRNVCNERVDKRLAALLLSDARIYRRFTKAEIDWYYGWLASAS